MTYKVTAVGDDWIDIWDQESLVSPDVPRAKAVDRIYCGQHPFLVDDIVDLSVRLVARVIPPEEELQQMIDREDREVFDQHG